MTKKPECFMARIEIGSPEWHARVEAMQTKIVTDIEHSGFSMIHVFGSETNASFTYTIGLVNKGLPELIMFGVPMQIVGHIWNIYYDQLITGQREPILGLSDEFFTSPVYAIECDPALVVEEYGVQAARFAGAIGVPIRFNQWVFCDKEGKFPWDADFAEEFKGMQPMLGATPK